MKESQFIQSNAAAWEALEEQLNQKKRGTGVKQPLGKQFAKVTDDLAYAQTFYKRRSVKRYLNDLSARLFAEVYAVPIKKPGQFWKFWKTDLPLALHEDRKALQASFLIFLLAAAIGVFSTYQDPEFTRVILGDGYVAMTEENIAKGDPLAVYKDDQPLMMFLQIFSNNLRVSILIFIGGLFYGIGTVGILFSNGVMLGTFQYYFTRHDLLLDSFLTIWQHGATEICAIIIAGGAGLTVGKHLLFPGTLPRFVAFKLGVTRGLRVLTGIAPVIFLAAFIESFITRHDDLPLVMRWLTILLSFAFMVGYYVWWPRKVGQSQRDTTTEKWQPSTATPATVQLGAIKKNGALLLDAINLLRTNGPVLMRSLTAVAVFWTLSILGFYAADFSSDFQTANVSGFIFQELAQTALLWWASLTAFALGFDFDAYPILYIVTAIAFATFQFEVNRWFYKQFRFAAQAAKPGSKELFYNILLWLALLAPLFFWSAYFWIVLALALPISAIQQTARTFAIQSSRAYWATAVQFFLGQGAKAFGLLIATTLFASLLVFLLQSPFLWIALSLSNTFIGYTELGAIKILSGLAMALGYLVLLMALATQQIAFYLFYHSSLEIHEAHELGAQLKNIQLKKSAYGVEKAI